jgi:hypothetical protein
MKGAVFLPLAAIVPVAIAAKLSKADVKYQDEASAGKDCRSCVQFIPGASHEAVATCKVVEGAISPHGYCLAFTPKPKPRV